ncbi:hypothetical protein [Caulobacter sp. 17J65-9]|uniref:hypothetical protein n=1 Tax=Caulobacter sp. 17J65-9 TaxID=2709382 RepID=UPI0013CB3BF6|nr:hypothetical protein [Caulobacter sp. 17J65-9]NEX92225.1 hypothetical protein [Caulobacter sp. 17J65-9]
MGPRFIYTLGLVCLAAGVALEFVGVRADSRWLEFGGVALMVLGTLVIVARLAKAVAAYLPGLGCLAVGAAAALFAGTLRSLMVVGVVLMLLGVGQVVFTLATRFR